MNVYATSVYPGYLMPVGAKYQYKPVGALGEAMPSNMSQRGVINPYTAHVHPYPTRFHGAIYTRPVFGLPFVPAPHAVFKPDDFHEFYADTAGLGTLAGGSLGLGATGTAIYYLAAATNTKVSTLQTALNKVLSANGYKLAVSVTGKLDATTCGALLVCSTDHKEDLLAEAPSDVVAEASKTCSAAMQNQTVSMQVNTFIRQLKGSRQAPVTSQVQVAAPVTSSTPAEVPADMPAIPKESSKVGPLVLGAVAVAGLAAFYFMRK